MPRGSSWRIVEAKEEEVNKDYGAASRGSAGHGQAGQGRAWIAALQCWAMRGAARLGKELGQSRATGD